MATETTEQSTSAHANDQPAMLCIACGRPLVVNEYYRIGECVTCPAVTLPNIKCLIHFISFEPEGDGSGALRCPECMRTELRKVTA